MCCVGRRVNNEISISDISVSRRQAEFQLVNNELFVTDNDSKFGTFKKLEGLTQLRKEQIYLPVQIEKKCFFFKLMERFSNSQKCKFCCMRSYPKESYDHFKRVYEKFPVVIRRTLLTAEFLKGQTKAAKAEKKVKKNKIVHDASIPTLKGRRHSFGENSDHQRDLIANNHTRNNSESLRNALSDIRNDRMDASERASVQQIRQALPLQRIDEASDYSGAQHD